MRQKDAEGGEGSCGNSVFSSGCWAPEWHQSLACKRRASNVQTSWPAKSDLPRFCRPLDGRQLWLYPIDTLNKAPLSNDNDLFLGRHRTSASFGCSTRGQLQRLATSLIRRLPQIEEAIVALECASTLRLNVRCSRSIFPPRTKREA